MTPSYLLAALAAAADPPVTAAAFRAFPTRVQPVLMNLCAGCHARPDHPSGFKLWRLPEGYADRQATLHNLLAASRFVRPDEPLKSRLLEMAVTPHGGRRVAPLAGRRSPPFRHLADWATAALPPPPPAPAAPPPAPAGSDAGR